jgi:hypothetical protein
MSDAWRDTYDHWKTTDHELERATSEAEERAEREWQANHDAWWDAVIDEAMETEPRPALWLPPPAGTEERPSILRGHANQWDGHYWSDEERDIEFPETRDASYRGRD